MEPLLRSLHGRDAGFTDTDGLRSERKDYQQLSGSGRSNSSIEAPHIPYEDQIQGGENDGMPIDCCRL